MTKRKTISVWLTIEDGRNKGKVALQRRSPLEDNFPYIYQASWAGKVESNEDDKKAIERECREELGDMFCDKFDFSRLIEINKSSAIRGEVIWECSNYLGKINADNLKMVKMHKDAYPDMIFVDSKDQIFSIESKNDPINNIVLFDDQYEVLKNILNRPH